MLELHRSVRSSNLIHQDSAVVRFDIWLSRKFGIQHRKIVGDNGVDFIIVPRLSNIRFVSHTHRCVRVEVV